MANALDRIKARATYPTPEGTFLHDAFYPVSEEIDHVLDVDLPEAFDRHMVDTATGEDLDRLSVAVGVYRKSAARATGMLQLSGAVGAECPIGALFGTEAGRLYALTRSGIIPPAGVLALPAQAVDPGAAGNAEAGTITRRVTAITGITSVTNPEAFGGGTDPETDALLRERVLDRLRNPPASGCARDYIRWAKEVPGVEDAKCLVRWDGPGTIKVVIAGTGMVGADAETVDACFLHVDEERPAGGPVLTVVSATPLAINVQASVVLQRGFTAAAVGEAFVPVLAAWLREQAFAAKYISHAQLGHRLLAVTGVQDYTDLRINGQSGNLALPGDSVPVTGTVTLSG